MQKIELKNKLITAPLAGITDEPFRKYIEQFSPGLIFTEMVSVEGIIRKNKNTLKMLEYITENTSIQIFGENPERICEAIKYIQENIKPYSIDINMGCPVKKIVKSGYGAALLREPKKIENILKAATKICLPKLTIKIRTGWDDNNLNYLEIGKIAENYDISAITLHPRTAKQFYSGIANWESIKKLKNHISIPVIGNGDILNKNDFYSKLSYCDYIMIGRGLLYNPILISQILKPNKIFLKNEIIQLIKQHLDLIVEHYGESLGIKRFRKHFAWYIKSGYNAKMFKEKGFQVTKRKDFISLIEEYFN